MYGNPEIQYLENARTSHPNRRLLGIKKEQARGFKEVLVKLKRRGEDGNKICK